MVFVAWILALGFLFLKSALGQVLVCLWLASFTSLGWILLGVVLTRVVYRLSRVI